MQNATGRVIKAFGNLLQVQFVGSIRQGEVAFVKIGDKALKSEVIEIVGDEAKIQVFEDTQDVEFGTPVNFTGDLLEAELGPGLISSIFDGLQNPLEEVAIATGLFLPRGVYLNALDRKKKWDFKPLAKKGDLLERGDAIGFVLEGRFHHKIMIPFSHFGKYTLTFVINQGTLYCRYSCCQSNR